MFPAVRKGLAEIDATIVLDKTFIRPKLREGDVALMEIAIEDGTYTSKAMYQLNAVHKCLGVQYLSELCHPNGRLIRSDYDVEKDILEYVPLRRRVKLTRPGKRCWMVFKKLICTVCSRGLCLSQPLGEWTADHSTNGRWRFYQGRERVFEFLSENWNEYTIQNNELIFAAKHVKVSLDGLLPTQVLKFLDRLRLEVTPERISSVELAPRDSFEDFLLLQPEWKQDLI